MQDETPFDVNTVTDLVVRRAVKISQLLHIHDAEWPDFPELPVRPVALVASGLSMLTPDSYEAFFGILRRYEYLRQHFGTIAMPQGRLEFETEQLVFICLKAWQMVDARDVWRAAEKIISQIEKESNQ